MTALNIAKPDAKTWFVCVMNHTGPLGTYREGDRLRGSHLDVTTNTLWWVDEDLDADQRNEVLQARIHAVHQRQLGEI
jgi:hypothetical protein